MNILIENQILSPVDIYDIYRRATGITIEKYDHYTKRTYRNRFKVISPNGIQVISIPVKHKMPSKYFKDIEIAYHNNWVGRLKNTLRTNYGSAPFFTYFADDIFAIFDKKHRYLFELNNELRQYVMELLDMDTDIKYTSGYIHDYNEEIIDLRDKYSPVTTQDTDSDYHYTQVFEYKYGFIPGMSILDYIFNAGTSGFLSMTFTS